VHRHYLKASIEAAAVDAQLAVAEFDDARSWLDRARHGPLDPFAVEVWVFDEDLRQVLLVRHRWRGWVPPGGSVEVSELPRDAARRELVEETGVRAQLLVSPAAVSVRSYHPDWSPTLGLSYAAVTEISTLLTPEEDQPVAWVALDQGWKSVFSEDVLGSVTTPRSFKTVT
jgi:8-oxo-dGTP diphosphatase